MAPIDELVLNIHNLSCDLLTESTRTNVKVIHGYVHALGGSSRLRLDHQSVVAGHQLVVGCFPLADCRTTCSTTDERHQTIKEQFLYSDYRKTCNKRGIEHAPRNPGVDPAFIGDPASIRTRASSLLRLLG